MAFNAASTVFGWQRAGARAKAFFQIITGGGDSAVNMSSDAPGVGWADAVAAMPKQGVSGAVGTSGATAGRSIIINCTTAGTATFTFLDGSTLAVTLPVGLIEFDWAVTGVTYGTAVATAFNTK